MLQKKQAFPIHTIPRLNVDNNFQTFSLSMDRWLLSQAHDSRMSPAALNLIQYVSSLDNKTIETIQELLSKASLVEKQN